MNTDMVFACGRVIERLLVCLFAGTSLVLGWDLFRKGVLIEQSAEFQLATWKASLRRVGPGIFFALFGASVSVFALRSPISISHQEARGQSQTATNSLTYRLPMNEINAIDVEYQNKGLTAPEAYKQLRDILTRTSQERTQ